MYSNPGKVLKTIGTIVFVVNLIFAILGSIPLFKLAQWQGIFVLYGFLVIGAGALIGYLCGLCFAAFGELVENSTKCEYYLSEIYKKMGGTAAYSTNTSSSGGSSASASAQPLSSHSSFGGSSASASAQPANSRFVKVCTICQTVNEASEYTCKNCGMGLPEATPAPASAEKTGGNSKFKTCPKCGAENASNARTCQECGGKL